MNKIAIIGSGDLGQLIAHHATTDQKKQVIGFFNDYAPKGELVNGKPILGGVKDILDLYQQGVFEALMVGIGYKHFAFRKKVFEQFKGVVPFANIIHSSCSIDSSCQLGEGIFILPGGVLDYNAQLGDNVLLNTACTIAHDSEVGNHTFLSPRVAMAGFIKVGACCNIGINTTIIDNITIVDNVQTGGGTVVTKNLDKAGLYVGIPARFIR